MHLYIAHTFLDTLYIHNIYIIFIQQSVYISNRLVTINIYIYMQFSVK